MFVVERTYCAVAMSFVEQEARAHYLQISHWHFGVDSSITFKFIVLHVKAHEHGLFVL